MLFLPKISQKVPKLVFIGRKRERDGFFHRKFFEHLQNRQPGHFFMACVSKGFLASKFSKR